MGPGAPLEAIEVILHASHRAVLVEAQETAT